MLGMLFPSPLRLLLSSLLHHKVYAEGSPWRNDATAHSRESFLLSTLIFGSLSVILVGLKEKKTNTCTQIYYLHMFPLIAITVLSNGGI